MPAPAKSRFEEAQPIYSARIRGYARRNFTSLPGTDVGDLEQELLEVLWLACNAYDPNHGATFNTFFWDCAKRRFLDLHKAASRQKRVGDYFRVDLEAESVRQAVAEATEEGSAEEEVLARISVRERLRAKVDPSAVAEAAGT